MRTTFAIVTLAAGLGLAASAQAAVVSYTSAAAFAAAAGATTTETFSSATPGQFGSGGAYGPVNFNGFSASGNGNSNYVGIGTGSLAVSGDNTPVPAPFAGQNFLGWGSINGGVIGTLTLTFTTPATAFAFDWFNTDVTDQYTLQLSSGETFSGPPFTVSNGSGAASGFFGVVSTTAFTSVSIYNAFNGGYISTEGFDNVQVSGRIAVPEPATLGLLAAGLVGVFGARRRARRAA